MSEVDFVGGKVSSSDGKHSFHLIPTHGLGRLADRFQLGSDRKGDKAWNATTHNQEVLVNIPFVLNRITHAMEHLLSLRDKIVAGTPMAGDDDAGAVAWSGIFLCEATRALEQCRLADRLMCSACGGSGEKMIRSVHPGELIADGICPACNGSRYQSKKS